MELNFLFTLDNKYIVDDTLLYHVGNNILALKSFKFDNDNLYYYTIDDIKNENVNIYKAMQYKGTNKFYYQNIYKNSNNPVGFVALSYKDKSHIIPDDDKSEILRMIGELKNFL